MVFLVLVANFMNSQPASCFSAGAAFTMLMPEPPPGTARCFCLGMKAAPTRAEVFASVCVSWAVELQEEGQLAPLEGGVGVARRPVATGDALALDEIGQELGGLDRLRRRHGGPELVVGEPAAERPHAGLEGPRVGRHREGDPQVVVLVGLDDAGAGQLLGDLDDLVPGVGRRLRQAGLTQAVLVVVHHRRAPGERDLVELAVDDAALEQAGHVGVQVGALVCLGEVVQRVEGPQPGEAGHVRVRGREEELRRGVGGEGGGELLRRLVVVADVLQGDLDVSSGWR